MVLFVGSLSRSPNHQITRLFTTVNITQNIPHPIPTPMNPYQAILYIKKTCNITLSPRKKDIKMCQPRPEIGGVSKLSLTVKHPVDTVWTHLCQHLYVNSPSLSGYRKRQRWIRGSVRLITGVPGVLYYVYLASLSHLDTVWTHLCQCE